jgi:hypothetical protein
MEQITKHSLCLMLASSILLASCASNAREAKIDTLKPVYKSYVADDNFKNYIKFLSTNINVPIENEKHAGRPQIDNIPLSEELLNYTFDLCEENDIPYTLMLAIMAVESNFNPKLVSSTSDYGLVQIHKPNIKPFAEAAGIEKVDPLNPSHNIRLGVYYLKYLKDKWFKYGFSDEQNYYMTVLSYNRGERLALDWVKRNGWKNTYVSKVSKVKSAIETNTYKEGE